MLGKNIPDIMGQYIMTHSVFKCLPPNNARRSKGKGGAGGGDSLRTRKSGRQINRYNIKQKIADSLEDYQYTQI